MDTEAQSMAIPVDPGAQEDSGFLPDDPAYQFDPAYDGRQDLELWAAKVGPIPPAQQIMASVALVRLHGYCKRSVRELQALIEHVGSDPKAKRFWGSPKSPAGWLKTRDDGIQTWQLIRKHWERAGGHFPRVEPTPAEVLDRTQYQPLPPMPAWDPACVGLGRGCRYGWVRDANNLRVPCPTCALGRWTRDHQTSPETLAAMDLSACGVNPAGVEQHAAGLRVR
jgi:hypothetical protein